MRLRNYPTKRKLLKDIENLRAENRHLSIELRNARTDLALEKTASSGYRHENKELRKQLGMLVDKPVIIFGGEEREGRSHCRY